MRWNWHELVAQLDDESMRLVVEGPAVAGHPPSSRGIVACMVRESGRVDKRKHPADDNVRGKGKGAGKEVLCHWVFVLLRTDGTTVFLRPNMRTTYVEYYERQPAAGFGPNFSLLPCPDVPSIQEYADTALYDTENDIDWQRECRRRELGVQRIRFLRHGTGLRGEGMRNH